ncbi:hypothetical protein, partial [Aeromonas caviae]|uniref:hypothetical protein n=1 Tax=Aeromonas caviae TaxID=648 RepID=UPI001CC6BF70
TDNSWVNMGVAQKPRSWPRWVNFTPALVGHFYIGGDNKPAAKRSAAVVDPRRWNRTVHLTSEYVH